MCTEFFFALFALGSESAHGGAESAAVLMVPGLRERVVELTELAACTPSSELNETECREVSLGSQRLRSFSTFPRVVILKP